METIIGDLIKMAKNGDFDVIVHGCNCLNAMGAGIAATVRSEFPAAYEADQRTVRGDKNKLGTYTYATVPIDNGKSVVVINAYTQYNYNAGSVDLFEYDGFEKILDKLALEFPGKKFGFPLIGCGLAGGNKERILDMIEQRLGTTQDVTIVEFIPPQNTGRWGRK